MVYHIGMKTAVSMPDDLFEDLTRAAEEEATSRSGMLAVAVREFLERRKNQKLLKDLNDAYAGSETPEEKQVRRAGRRSYSRRLSREKW